MNNMKIFFVAILAVMLAASIISIAQADGASAGDSNAPGDANNDGTTAGVPGSSNTPTDDTNNDPGFFKRVWRAMIGSGQGDTTPQGFQGETCEGASICYTTEGKVLCEASYAECLQKYGQCRCGKDTSPGQVSSCPNGLLYCKANGKEIRCTGVPEEQQCIEKYGKENCYCSQPTSQDNPNEDNGRSCDNGYILICKNEGSEIQCAGNDQKECMNKYGNNNCFCKRTPTYTNNDDPNNRLTCDPCSSIVCKYESGGIFVCPGDIKSCTMKFGDSCQEVGCYRDACTEKIHVCKDSKTGSRTQCQGSLDSCNERYNGGCICGVPPSDSDCQETTHLCYAPQDTSGSDTTTASSSQPQQCQGKYEDCLAKYKELGGKCQCGIPQVPVCDKKVHLCKSTSDNTASAPSIVNCEGSYDECVAKFGQCRCGTPETQYCTYDNQKHKIDSEWSAGDGCNICACKPNGVVTCTKRACPAPTDCDEEVQTCYTLSPSSAAQPQPIKCPGTMAYCTEKYGKCDCGWKDENYCLYDGAKYKYGETFKDGDGCNVCNCLENGQVICTDKACPAPIYCEWKGATYKPGESWSAGDNCNTCSCTLSTTAATAKVVCTTKVCTVCDEQRNVCKTAAGAQEYCSASYDDCVAKYKNIGGTCECGGTIDTAINKQSYRLTTSN